MVRVVVWWGWLSGDGGSLIIAVSENNCYRQIHRYTPILSPFRFAEVRTMTSETKSLTHLVSGKCMQS